MANIDVKLNNNSYLSEAGDYSPYHIVEDDDYFSHAIFNLSSFPYEGELKVIATWEVTVKVMLYVIIILLALFGNTVVMIIVWRNKRLRTTTNYYLVNLAVADLMVTLTCTWVHLIHDLTEGWVLGAFFCKFNSFAQVLSLVCSILTLTVISCDRFFGIVFAMKAHLTERRARTCIMTVWICSVAVASPLLMYRRQFHRIWANHTEVWCDDDWPPVWSTNTHTVHHPSRSIYYTLVTVLLFFLPIIVMSVAYSFVIWRLWSKRYPGERIESGTMAQNKVKRKVIIMLVVLMAVFVVCWLPLQASILYSVFRSEIHQQLPHWYGNFQYVTTFLAYSNSAINPIIYAGFNENFRIGFLLLFGVRRALPKRSSVSWRRNSSFSTTMVTRI